jgi:phage-related protein
MYEISFYEDKNGYSEVYEVIKGLTQRIDKHSRINANKINDYIQILSIHGTVAGEPYIKHISDDIWELRPLKHRVLFAIWDGNGFILLHHFIKKTQKTPKRELYQAERNLRDMRERSGTP